MKTIFIYTAFFLAVFFSCKKNSIENSIEEKADSSSFIITNNDNFVYNEILDIQKSSDYDEIHEVKKLDVTCKSLVIKIRYLSERAYIAVQNEDNQFVNWQPFQINFYYDMTFTDAEKDIHLLLRNNETSDGYILVPEFTEQYPAYFLYKFSKNSFNYMGSYELQGGRKGSFSFNEKSNELSILSSDSVKKLKKIKGTEAEKFNRIEKDIQLLNGSDHKKSIGNFSQYSHNKNYFIRTFDVNNDGIDDKLVSQNRYMGDEMLVFLGDKNNKYNLALESTNFSEDGGNQIADLKKSDDGYEIITQFPDRGYLQKSYSVSVKNNQFILKKITTESDSWQDNYREKCLQDINFNLKKSKEELYKAISKTQQNCMKTVGNQSEVSE